jgi:hypothetical protein
MKIRKFLITNFEFGGKFSLSMEGNCHEVGVISNLKLLSHFWFELEALYISNLEGASCVKKFFEKSSLLLGWSLTKNLLLVNNYFLNTCQRSK